MTGETAPPFASALLQIADALHGSGHKRLSPFSIPPFTYDVFPYLPSSLGLLPLLRILDWIGVMLFPMIESPPLSPKECNRSLWSGHALITPLRSALCPEAKHVATHARFATVRKSTPLAWGRESLFTGAHAGAVSGNRWSS